MEWLNYFIGGRFTTPHYWSNNYLAVFRVSAARGKGHGEESSAGTSYISLTRSGES
jgi:hypothetical protein